MVKSSVSSNHEVEVFRFKSCPFCGGELNKKYRQDRRTVHTLEGAKRVERYAYVCLNRECRRRGKIILPGRTYPKGVHVGWDVVTRIGWLRTKENKTLEQIKDELWVSFGLGLCENTVRNLSNLYLQFIGTTPHPSRLNNLRSRGNVILSIDGIKPQVGNVTLYIIRDLVSGTVLVARALENSATEYIVPLMTEVRDLKLPVVGIVSDKQSGFVLAVKEVFPDKPHQFCVFHYLKDIAKEAVEMDRAMRKNIRSGLRAVLKTKKTLVNQKNRGDLPKGHFTVLNRLYVNLRALTRATPNYPLKTVGIQLYDGVQVFHDTIKFILKNSKGETRAHIPLTTALKHIGRILETFKEQYLHTKRRYGFVYQVEKQFVEEGTQEECETDLKEYVVEGVIFNFVAAS